MPQSKPSRQFYKLPTALAARRDLRSTAKLAFAAIRDAAWDGVAKIGIRRLAKLIGCSRGAVLRAIRELVGRNLLRVDPGRNGQRATYFLPDEPPPERARSGKAKPSPKQERSAKQYRPHNGTTPSPKRVRNRPHNGNTYRADLYSDVAPSDGAASGTRKNSTDTGTLIGYFCDRWSGRHDGAKYPFDRKKDPTAAKRILEHAGGLDGAKRVVDKYLGTDDNWLVVRGLTLSVLASNSQLPRFLTARTPETAEPSPPPRESHPILVDAERRGWADDVGSNPAEWRAVVDRVEAGELSTMVVKRSKATTGTGFRKSVKPKGIADVG